MCSALNVYEGGIQIVDGSRFHFFTLDLIYH